MSALDRRCSCCGGELPEEGSEMWEASEGTCSGSVHERDGTAWCGAFDPALRAEVRS